jgi:hypothetical protein
MCGCTVCFSSSVRVFAFVCTYFRLSCLFCFILFLSWGENLSFVLIFDLSCDFVRFLFFFPLRDDMGSGKVRLTAVHFGSVT